MSAALVSVYAPDSRGQQYLQQVSGTWHLGGAGEAGGGGGGWGSGGRSYSLPSIPLQQNMSPLSLSQKDVKDKWERERHFRKALSDANICHPPPPPSHPSSPIFWGCNASGSWGMYTSLDSFFATDL